MPSALLSKGNEMSPKAFSVREDKVHLDPA
jgi:hypothetical protein